MINPGYDPEEIEKLREECKIEGHPFVIVADEYDLEDTGEYVQFQFVGKKDGKEVIYDVAMFTLRMQHANLLLEEAEKLVQKKFRDFVPLELRTEHYKPNEQADEMIQDFMEELEEDESITVAEYLEEDLNFEFGIGLEVVLNVDEISTEIINKFIEEFNAGTFKTNNTEVSFKHQEDEG